MNQFTPQEKTTTGSRARHRFVRWIALAVILVIGGFVLWHVLQRKPATRTAAAQIVKVAPATQGDMPVVLNELGTVMPTATVTVMPNQAVSGYLTEVPFRGRPGRAEGPAAGPDRPAPLPGSARPGDRHAGARQGHPQRGQDGPRALQKLVERRTRSRASRPRTRVYVVHQDEGTVKLDQAAVDTAKLNLSYCRITAPVTGRVGLRLVDPGNYITGSSSTGVARHHDDQADDGPVHGRPERPREGRLALSHAGREAAGHGLQQRQQHASLPTGTLYAINNQIATSTGTVTLRATLRQ